MECRKCGIVLNENNCFSSYLERKIYLCIECKKKYYIRKTTNCIKCGSPLVGRAMWLCPECKKLSIKLKNYKKNHTQKAKRRRELRKRLMEFIELNSWFEGSNAHHITNKFVIYIREDLHKSIIHNHKNLNTMDLINTYAYEELFGHGIYTTF